MNGLDHDSQSRPIARTSPGIESLWAGEAAPMERMQRTANSAKGRLFSRMLFPFLISLMLAFPLTAGDVRLGIIGTDTSHATAFARVLNNPTAPDYLPGARIVAAWKGGSADIEESAKR